MIFSHVPIWLVRNPPFFTGKGGGREKGEKGFGEGRRIDCDVHCLYG